MQSRGVTGTADWRRYTIELPVDANGKEHQFRRAARRAMAPPGSTASRSSWTASHSPTRSVMDLDFESASPRGFFTGGDGYRVAIDTSAYSGRENKAFACARRAAARERRGGNDPTAAVARWGGGGLRASSGARIVPHGRRRRTRHRLGNAERACRLQADADARRQLVSRDRSMADNVKWILDQNPNAKIVLWAHNGHVATRSSRIGRWARSCDGCTAADGGVGILVQSRIVSGNAARRRS